MRFWKWTLATTAFLAVLTGCATASHTTTSAAKTGTKTGTTTGAVVPVVAARSATTRNHHFSPFTGGGRLRVQVATKESGSCWETSLAAPSASAFRCLSGNTILDPCFVSSARKGTATCLADPWSRATVLTLAKKLPKPDVTANDRPWALELNNGARCVAATGTAAFVHGKNLDYICSNGYAAGLFKPRARQIAAAYAEPTAKTYTRTTVRALWHT